MGYCLSGNAEAAYQDPDYDDEDGPSEFEVAVGDLQKLVGNAVDGFGFASDVVDGFAGSDPRAANRAIRSAATLVERHGADTGQLRQIVAAIGTSAGRGRVWGERIAADFERKFWNFVDTRRAARGADEQEGSARNG